MKPNTYEYRLLLKEDERLAKLKEAEWERLGHGDPRGMMLECVILSLPLLGQALLLLGLLHEVLSKWGRMFWIMVKVGYFYATKSIRK